MSAGLFTTEEEQTALRKFRLSISDLIDKLGDRESHDANLLRWLRARDLNVEKAEEMLRKSWEWRIENNIDELANDSILDEYLLKNMSARPGGVDKGGALIFVCPFGRWDMKEMINDGYKEKMYRHLFKVLEIFSKHIQSLDMANIQTQVVIIFDYDQFSMKQVFSQQVVRWLINFFQQFDANYPERMKAAFVVNVPKIFEIFWPMINTVLSPRTLSKVRVLGGGPERWRPKLREYIDSYQLPSDLGGTNTTYNYLSNSFGLSIMDYPRAPSYPLTEFISVNVNAGEKFTRDFDLLIGETISWNFKTEDYDIGFEIRMNGKLMFPYAKADAHLFVQDGIMTAIEDCNCTLTFDNGYSRYRSKTLHYVVYVGEKNVTKS